jgi:hypothetical protein
MFMENFSSLACTQMDLEQFWTIFEENFRIFQENFSANSKNFQTWVRNYQLNQAKHVHAKFYHSSFYPDGLRHIFDHFWRKFQDFSGKPLSGFEKIQIWVCNLILNLAKLVLAKFQLSSFYQDGFRQIFYHFWRKFLDFPGQLLSEFQNNPNLSM